MKDFKCGYCGKEYDSPENRARCEIACAEKIRKENEDKRYNDFMVERKAREKKIHDMLNNRIDVMVKLDNEIKNEIKKYDDDFKTSFSAMERNKDFWDMVNSLIW